MADIVSTLNDVQPDILQGYPSTVYQLTLEAKKGRLQINPAVVRLGSEHGVFMKGWRHRF